MIDLDAISDVLDPTAQDLVAQWSAINQAVIVAITDVKGRISYTNDIFCRISGYSRDELLGSDHRILNSGTHSAAFFRAMYREIASGKVWRGEICNKAKNGSLYWVDTTIVPRLGPDGRPIAYMAARIDITDRKAAERALRDSQVEVTRKSSQLELALASINHGLCMFDDQQRVIICNERYASMYGLSSDDIKPGTTLTEIALRRIEKGIYAVGSPDDYVRERLAPVTKAAYVVHELNDGRAVAISREPIPGGGWVTTHQDITERRRTEAEVIYMARHDILTGLANRTVLQEKMEEALARQRRSNEAFMIFLLDLDNFKSVNDSLGHPVGDRLLKAVTRRLLACTRETDLVARLGGDEFVILTAEDKAGGPAATTMAERLLEAIAAPYDIDGHKINIGTSIGIVLAPEHGSEVDQLIKNADLALYEAKSRGRNTHCFFESGMAARIEDRRSLEAGLRSALAQREFVLLYQPMVSMETREIVGAEALIRWRHPQRGLVTPDDFIPLAEEINLISPIGEWVLRQACCDAAQWPPHVRLAVNLSPLQFGGDHLVDIVLDALAISGLSPERLELEITETVLMQGNAQNIAILHQLRSHGISVVLDDFGTGYSSLSYIRMFAFDKIKIDRSFISELATNAECRAIVSAVAGLGGSLGIDTVAEGVETKEQLTLVRAAGCTYAQGYLIGRPCPAPEFKTRSFTEPNADEIAA